MLLEVVRMSSLVEVVLGDVRSFRFVKGFKLICSTQSSDFDYFWSTVSLSFHRIGAGDCADD
jgi:hypothetical protein